MVPHELVVIRHAKSDWGDATLADFDRPLNARGQRDAPRIGRWLAAQGWLPGWWLSSPALRARQSVLAMVAAGGAAAEDIVWEPRLYGADLPVLLDIIAGIPEEVSRAAVVGHNPGLEQLVEWLSGGRGLTRTRSGALPTAGVVVLGLAGPWSRPVAGGAAVLAQVRPKALAEDERR